MQCGRAIVASCSPDNHPPNASLATVMSSRNYFKEETMFEVTPAATEQIAAYFSDKEVRPIRIFLNEGG